VAIGHPEQGALWALPTGVISAEVDNFNGVKGKQVFHTETGLNRGNSGGPLLDGEGWMIGVNTRLLAWPRMVFRSPASVSRSSRASPDHGCGNKAWGFELDKGRRCPLDKRSL